MAWSPAFSLYLFISKHGSRFAERLLRKRLNSGKEDPKRIDERRGITETPRPIGQVIWFHAASVGESLSLIELITRLNQKDPDLNYLITTGTVTSAEILHSRLPKNAIHQYLPVDTYQAVSKFLDHWQPNLAIWTESELWPRLIHETAKRKIPMLMINARMSQKSFRNWRWFKGSIKKLLGYFGYILSQENLTTSRLNALGVAPDHIETIGTLKEGSPPLPYDEHELKTFKTQLKSRPVWVAASTHPGEEELILKAHKTALKSAHDLLLILVPRHPERGEELAKLIEQSGLSFAQRSQNETPTERTSIYLADTLGELGLWFRLAQFTFIGGSLVPVGGHNPFEPAALGAAIITGPHYSNFLDIYNRLLSSHAAKEITDLESLSQHVTNLLAPDLAAQYANAAWDICSENSFVTDRTIEVILSTLKEDSK